MGCLLATVGLTACCALFYAVQRAPFVLGSPETGKRLIASNGVRAIERALDQILVDAEVNDVRLFFREDVRLNYPTFPASLAKHSRLARELLAKGAGFHALREEVARKLKPDYLLVRPDPWGRPYQVLFSPDAELEDSDFWQGETWTPIRQRPCFVFSLGENGLIDLGSGPAPAPDIYSTPIHDATGP